MAMNKHTVFVSTTKKYTEHSSTASGCQEVIILKGVPCSGKTTFALELQRNNPGKFKRVNKEELRAMIDMGKYSKKKEKYINDVRDAVIGIAVADGYSVIVDDINLNPVHEARIRKLIEGYNDMLEESVEVSVINFHEGLELSDVLARNAQAGGPERPLEDIMKKGHKIMNLWKKYVKRDFNKRTNDSASGDSMKCEPRGSEVRCFDFSGKFPRFENEDMIIVMKKSELKPEEASSCNA